MKKITTNIEIVPNEAFAMAFIKLFKCKPGEFEIEMIDENQSALAIYKEGAYRIETFEYLKVGVETMLTDKYEAQQVDLSIWGEVSAPVLKNPKFFTEVIDVLDNWDHADMFRLALSISSFAENTEEVFWLILQKLDKTGELFGSIILAAAKSQNFERLVDDLTNHQIIYGDTVYNPFDEGIFEVVYLENTITDVDLTFYIYSAMV